MSDRAYVVTSGDYSDYRVHAVFTDLAAAIAAAEEQNKSDEFKWYKYRVEVVPLNHMRAVSSGWYEVYMPLNGGDEGCYTSPEVPLPGERGPVIRHHHWGDELVMIIEARDCEHAMKIAGERKTRLMVTGEIGQISRQQEALSD